jgi:hypothetical protein
MGKHITLNLAIGVFDITTNPFTLDLTTVAGKSYSRMNVRIAKMGVRTTNNRLIFRIVAAAGSGATNSYNKSGALQNDAWGTERPGNDDRVFNISEPTPWLNFNTANLSLIFADENSAISTPIPIGNINGFITFECVLFQ